MRLMAATMSVAAGVGLSIAVAAPASAGAGCIRTDYSSTAYDYARTTDASGKCGTLGVRHQYDPVWSSTNYWTSWYSTTGDAVQTPATAELFASGHSGS